MQLQDIMDLGLTEEAAIAVVQAAGHTVDELDLLDDDLEQEILELAEASLPSELVIQEKPDLVMVKNAIDLDLSIFHTEEALPTANIPGAILRTIDRIQKAEGNDLQTTAATAKVLMLWRNSKGASLSLEGSDREVIDRWNQYCTELKAQKQKQLSDIEEQITKDLSSVSNFFDTAASFGFGSTEFNQALEALR